MIDFDGGDHLRIPKVASGHEHHKKQNTQQYSNNPSGLTDGADLNNEDGNNKRNFQRPTVDTKMKRQSVKEQLPEPLSGAKINKHNILDSGDRTGNIGDMNKLLTHYSASATDQIENAQRLGSHTGSFAGNSTMKGDQIAQLNLATVQLQQIINLKWERKLVKKRLKKIGKLLGGAKPVDDIEKERYEREISQLNERDKQLNKEIKKIKLAKIINQ